MVSLQKVLSCYKFTCCVFVIDKAMPQFEALLELIEGNTKIQSNSEAA